MILGEIDLSIGGTYRSPIPLLQALHELGLPLVPAVIVALIACNGGWADQRLLHGDRRISRSW